VTTATTPKGRRRACQSALEESAEHFAAVETAARYGLARLACDLAHALLSSHFAVLNAFESWWRTHQAAMAAAGLLAKSCLGWPAWVSVSEANSLLCLDLAGPPKGSFLRSRRADRAGSGALKRRDLKAAPFVPIQSGH
jgi:hypothetical protein